MPETCSTPQFTSRMRLVSNYSCLRWVGSGLFTLNGIGEGTYITFLRALRAIWRGRARGGPKHTVLERNPMFFFFYCFEQKYKLLPSKKNLTAAMMPRRPPTPNPCSGTVPPPMIRPCAFMSSDSSQNETPRRRCRRWSCGASRGPCSLCVIAPACMWAKLERTSPLPGLSKLHRKAEFVSKSSTHWPFAAHSPRALRLEPRGVGVLRDLVEVGEQDHLCEVAWS
jgi:hypothetical protein